MESQFRNIHKLMEEIRPTQTLKNLHDEISQIDRTSIENSLLLDSSQNQVAQMVDNFRESSGLLAGVNIEDTATLALESIAKLNIPNTAELALGSIANLNITDTYEKTLAGNLLAENIGEMQGQLHSTLAELEKSQFEILNQHRNLADEFIEQQRKLAQGSLITSIDLAHEATKATELLARYSPDITLSSLMKEVESISNFTNNSFQRSIEAIDSIRGKTSVYDLLSSGLDSFNSIVRDDEEFDSLKENILKKENRTDDKISAKEDKLKQTVNYYVQFLKIIGLLTTKTKFIKLSKTDIYFLASILIPLYLSQSPQQNNNINSNNDTNKTTINITNNYYESSKKPSNEQPVFNKPIINKKYRQISGTDVILRHQPSRKSDFIEYLQNGEKIQVLDSKNRKWLHIRVQIENEVIEGWVFRRYTKRIKK